MEKSRKRKAEEPPSKEEDDKPATKTKLAKNSTEVDDVEAILVTMGQKSSGMDSTSTAAALPEPMEVEPLADGPKSDNEDSAKNDASGAENDGSDEVKVSDEMSQVDKLLADTSLWDIIGSPDRLSQLLVFYHDMTVEQAMEKLAQHKYLSAPVILTASVEELPATHGSFLGLVDTHNILEALVLAVRDSGIELFDDESRRDSWKKALDHIGQSFHAQKLITICDFNDARVVSSAELNMSLLDLIRSGFLAPSENAKQPPAHRLAVFSGTGAPLAVISQSDIVRFLTENMESLGKLKNRQLDQLGFLTEVIMTPDSALTIDAFSLMFDSSIAAVAVVDDNGKLVGNLSASDLRGLKCGDFDQLLVSVKDFLKKRHEMDKSIPDHVIALHPDATLEEALNCFKEHGVHRIYISSRKDCKPIGLCTLTDVLTLISMC